LEVVAELSIGNFNQSVVTGDRATTAVSGGVSRGSGRCAPELGRYLSAYFYADVV
jgi:hypothetical protein